MTRIPKTLHFCFGLVADFQDKSWSLVHYACVKSAIWKIKPSAVYFYFEHEPSGPWWELTKPMITPVRVTAPTEIFGNRLVKAAHRADVLRLEKLMQFGGIYLDTDVLVVRDFGSLLNESCVLAQEGLDGSVGLCNAVIAAEIEAPFIRRWYETYRTFRGSEGRQYYNEHAVRVPKQLALKHPGEITVLDHKAFFWPMWTDEHVKLL